MVHAPEPKSKVVWGCRRGDRGRMELEGSRRFGIEIEMTGITGQGRPGGRHIFLGQGRNMWAPITRHMQPWIRRDDSGNS